jgi:hypothetical protein
MIRLAPRLWVLAGVLALGYSVTFALPETPPMRASRLSTELPELVSGGEWKGAKLPVSERERAVLADDTRFERRYYEPTYPMGRPGVEASFVYSGQDMNNSIHRPEVCLRTQGWNFVRERYVVVPGVMPDGGDLPVREIICSKTSRHPETGKTIQLPNGKLREDWQILYYTFIGAEEVTPSHYGRVFRDIRDRVVGGFDQQWAYATFSSLIPGKYQEQGMNIGTLDPLDIDQTGEHLASFMRALLPSLLIPKDTTVASLPPSSP